MAIQYILPSLYTVTKMCAKVRCFSACCLLAKLLSLECFCLFLIGRHAVGMETCVFPLCVQTERCYVKFFSIVWSIFFNCAHHPFQCYYLSIPGKVRSIEGVKESHASAPNTVHQCVCVCVEQHCNLSCVSHVWMCTIWCVHILHVMTYPVCACISVLRCE